MTETVSTLKHDLLAESKMYWWLPESFKQAHIPYEVKKHLDHMVEEKKKTERSEQDENEALEELCRGHIPDEKEPLITEDPQDCEKISPKSKSSLLGMFFEDEASHKEEEHQDKKKRRVSNKQYTEGEFVPGMFDVCGPPLWKIMPLATFCQLCGTVLLPLLAFYVSSCVGEDEMYATYPRWLWIPFIPWLIIMSILDWRCFTYTVVPKIAMLERFTLGPLSVTFRQWTFYIAVKSIITHAEVWSQGLVVASALHAAGDCRGWKGLESLWSTSWKQSMFYHAFPEGEHLWFLACLSWGFLVLQQILYILRALPMRTGTEYHCASEKDGYMVWICCSRIWHADALNTLANANRMVAAQYGIRKYSVCRAYFKLKNDKLGSFFHILKMDMRIFLWDMVFVNLLQTCAKLVFQTALWCLLRSTDRHVFFASPVVLKTLVPLCLAHVTSFMSFCSNLIDWLEVRETRVKVRKERGKDMNLADFREYDKLATFERLVGAILMLQILFQILYAFKFVKSFQCEYGLWNLNVGCVNIPTPSE